MSVLPAQIGTPDDMPHERHAQTQLYLPKSVDSMDGNPAAHTKRAIKASQLDLVASDRAAGGREGAGGGTGVGLGGGLG